ncbi:hypothetical protein AO825_08470 [Pectobacterium brasiliense]|nr:hypothetical protein KS44_06465 [Pectobacterium brasiliense]KRF62885.1 hypothetical protein AO825_08470 [Pectobacterium brasiliense]
MRINKRQAEFIHPAVVYGWEIYVSPFRKSALWDDDPMTPVKVGPLLEGLIDVGVMERVESGSGFGRIRISKIGRRFLCPYCFRGRTYRGSDDPEKTVPCAYCINGVRLDTESKQ